MTRNQRIRFPRRGIGGPGTTSTGPGLMPDVARRLLGEPTRASARAWRYGKKGSLKINLGAGTWKDFEAGEGGGVRALVQREADRPARCSRRVDPSGIPAKKGPQKAPESTNAPAPAPGLFKTATTAWGGAWPHRQQHPGAKIGGGVSVRRGNPGPRLPDEAAGVAGGRLRPCPNPCDGSRPRRLRACCAGLMNSCPRANGRVLWLSATAASGQPGISKHSRPAASDRTKPGPGTAGGATWAKSRACASRQRTTAAAGCMCVKARSRRWPWLSSARREAGPGCYPAGVLHPAPEKRF